MYPESPNEIFLPLVFWIVGAIVSFDEIVRSRNVRNIGKFKERTSKKRQKLESKLENQS